MWGFKQEKKKTKYRNNFWDSDDYYTSDFYFSRTYKDKGSIVKNIVTDNYNANQVITKTKEYIQGKIGKQKFENEHLIMDAYSLFSDINKNRNDIEYFKSNPKEQEFIDFCENKSVLRTFTNQNTFCSYLISRELYSTYVEIEEQDKKDKEDGKGDQGNNGQNEEKYNKALQDGYKQYENLKQIKDQIQENEDSGDGLSKNDFQKEMETLDTIEKFINGKKVNFEVLKKFTKSLEGTVASSFSNNNRYHEVSLFDAEHVSVIDNIESLIHPVFYEELSTKEPKGTMCFNIYIDRSGSMGANMHGDLGNNLERFDVAKLFALQMYANKLVKDFNLFDDSVHPKNFAALLSAKTQGGTSINTVIADCENKKKYSIILTDGDDYVSYYSPYVYFVVFTDSDPLAYFNSNKGVRDMYLSQNRILKCSSSFDLVQPVIPSDYQAHGISSTTMAEHMHKYQK
jgi:hypothetical protein